MDKKEFFSQEAFEANTRLKQAIEDDGNSPHHTGTSQESSTMEANLKLQEAFYPTFNGQ